jgi:hypothetical protein
MVNIIMTVFSQIHSLYGVCREISELFDEQCTNTVIWKWWTNHHGSGKTDVFIYFYLHSINPYKVT